MYHFYQVPPSWCLAPGWCWIITCPQFCIILSVQFFQKSGFPSPLCSVSLNLMFSSQGCSLDWKMSQLLYEPSQSIPRQYERPDWTTVRPMNTEHVLLMCLWAADRTLLDNLYLTLHSGLVVDSPYGHFTSPQLTSLESVSSYSSPLVIWYQHWTHLVLPTTQISFTIIPKLSKYWIRRLQLKQTDVF